MSTTACPTVSAASTDASATERAAPNDASATDVTASREAVRTVSAASRNADDRIAGIGGLGSSLADLGAQELPCLVGAERRESDDDGFAQQAHRSLQGGPSGETGRDPCTPRIPASLAPGPDLRIDRSDDQVARTRSRNVTIASLKRSLRSPATM